MRKLARRVFSAVEDLILAKQYVYKPLRAREIRLLKVRSVGPPGKWKKADIIHASLDETPGRKFIALSYTWGDPAFTGYIQCGHNHFLLLSKSVEEILDHFALQKEECYLWIDFLCINQRDKNEKKEQIPLMREIYQRASKVIIWLGPEAEGSATAVKMITLLSLRFQIPLTPTFGSICAFLGFNWPGPEYTALCRFLSRPWFERMWVIQEVVLGKDVEIRCGNDSMSWDDFTVFVNSVRVHGLLPLINSDHTKEGPQVGSISALNVTGSIDGFRTFRSAGIPIGIQDALLECCQYKTSEPRDKIYGLLGIADDVDHQAFDPDYDQTVEDLYTKTTRHLLLSESSISFLSQTKAVDILHSAGIGLPRQLGDIPSWVPDWTAELEITCLGNIAPFAGFKASGEVASRLQIDNEDNSLRIAGVVIDSVSMVSAPCPSAHGNLVLTAADRAPAWIESCMDLLKGQTSLSCETLRDMLWRTLIADRTHLAVEAAPEVYGQYFDTFMKIGNNNDGGEARAEDMVGVGLYTAAMTQICPHRSVFATPSGRIGLCWPRAQEGDILCILLGTTTPFLLRRQNMQQDGVFQLVGECYVHGLMHGEGLGMGKMEETFRII